MPFPSMPCAASQMARYLLRNRIVTAPPRCTAAQQQNAASDADHIKILRRNLSVSERIGFDLSRRWVAQRAGENTERFPFEIQDDTGKSIVTLRRRYHGEDIEVTLGTRYRVTREEHDAMNLAAGGDSDNEGESDDVKCDYCENCKDEDCTCYCHSSGSESDDNSCVFHVPLTVRVRKGERSPSLEFICSYSTEFVKIDAVYLKHDPSNWGMRAYEGPDFNGLSKDMQKALHKYLDRRGISSYGDYFLICMLDKACRENRHWLRSMKQFVDK